MLRKRTLVNIHAECPIISVRSASPVGSLSFQVKPRTRRWSPAFLPPSAGILGCFFVVVVILGFSLSRCGVVLVFYFPYFFGGSFLVPLPSSQSAMETSLWSVIATAFLFCSVSTSHVCFSLSFITFLYFLSWRKAVACFPCFFTCVCMDPWGSDGFTCVYGDFFFPALPVWWSSLTKWNIYHFCNA